MPINSEHWFGFFCQNFAAFMYRPLEPDLTLIKESMALTDIWAFNQVPSVLFQSLAITQVQQRTCSFTSKYKVCGFKASPWRGRGECTRFYKEQISSCGWILAVALKSIHTSDRQTLGAPEQIHWLPLLNVGTLLPPSLSPCSCLHCSNLLPAQPGLCETSHWASSTHQYSRKPSTFSTQLASLPQLPWTQTSAPQSQLTAKDCHGSSIV